MSLSLDKHWKKVFELTNADRSTVSLAQQGSKSIALHFRGNADFERGFSENSRILLERARLTIQSVNGIQQVHSYAKRFEGDPSQFVVTPSVINAVQGSSKR